MTTETLIQNIIDNDIYANASTMVTELMQDPEGRYVDDLVSCLDGPDFSEPPEGFDIIKNMDEGTVQHFSDDTGTSLEEFDTEEEAIEAAWEDSGDEPERIEALQHWLVSDTLADELEEVGALVARDILGFNIWGRTECGQSLTEDADIKRVAALIQARIDNL